MTRANKKVLTCIFIFFIVCWFTITIISGIHEVNERSKKNGFNSAALYPYPEPKKAQKKSVFEKINNSIDVLQNNVTGILESHSVAINQIAEITKFFDKYIYQYNVTTAHNDVFNDKSQSIDLVILHQSGEYSYLIDNSDISSHIESFVTFAKKMQESNKQILLFIPPSNDEDLKSIYLNVYQDYSDEKEEQIVSECNSNDIDCLLFSDYLKANNKQNKDVFFRTDHHWLPENGIIACKMISEWLNQRGYEIDPSIYDLNQYTIKLNSNPMIGSFGKKVTLVYTDPEYMPIIKPKYTTDISAFISRDNTTKTGMIDEILLYDAFLDGKDIYNNTQYYYYGNKDHELIEIHNNELHDGKKILLIKNSFANCVYPFMCHMAENVSVIDLRHFQGCLDTYIKQYNPDTIIVMYTVAAFSNFTDKYDLAFNF